MSEWYYILEGRPQGPLSEPEMRHVLSCGALPATTLVWCAGMSAWTNATVLPDLQINKEFEKPAQSAEQSKEKSVPMAPMQAIQSASINKCVEQPLAESSPATLSAPPATGTTKSCTGADVLESIETPRSASNPLGQSKSDSQQPFSLIRTLLPLLGGAAILTFAIWLVQQLVAPKVAMKRQGVEDKSADSKQSGNLGNEPESPSSRIAPRKEVSFRRMTGLESLDEVTRRRILNSEAMRVLRERGLSEQQAVEAFLLISHYGFTVQQVLSELSAARQVGLMNKDASDAFMLSDPERLRGFLGVLSAARDLFR